MRFDGSLLAVLVAATSTTSQLVVASNNTYRTSRVAVHIPFSLHDPNGEEHVQAEFGFVQSIGSISQYLYYTDSFLCDPLVNHTQGFPSGGFKRTFIMMADRGSPDADPCSFVTKARHAQQAGAAALVIADTRCPCSDQACLNEQNTDECESTTPALVNDGSGADVSIPSFLLFKNVADKIKKELRNDQSVSLRVLSRRFFKNQNAPSCNHMQMLTFYRLSLEYRFNNIVSTTTGLDGTGVGSPEGL
jgi:hypothetical protein